MKRLGLCLIASLVAGTAHATSGGPDFLQVRNVKEDDVLNIRSEPTPQSKIVGFLEPNMRGIPNLGCLESADLVQYLRDKRLANVTIGRVKRGETWCRIRHPSKSDVVGWINGSFVMEDETPEPISSPPYSRQVGEEGAQFESYIDHMTPMGGQKFTVSLRLVTKNSRTTALPNGTERTSVSVDCPKRTLSDPDRGTITITISEDPTYRPPRSTWDDENLWWAVCQNTFEKYRYDTEPPDQVNSGHVPKSEGMQGQTTSPVRKPAPKEVGGQSLGALEARPNSGPGPENTSHLPSPSNPGIRTGDPIVDIVLRAKSDPNANKALAGIAKQHLPSIAGRILRFDGFACSSRDTIIEVSRSSNHGLGQLFPGGSGGLKDIAQAVNKLVASKDCVSERPAGYVEVEQEDPDYPVYLVRDVETNETFWTTRAGLK